MDRLPQVSEDGRHPMAVSTATTTPRTTAPEQIQSVIDALKQAIWKRRPILGEIMTKHGEKILNVYVKDFLDVNPAPGLNGRKQELIKEVGEMTESRLGKSVADRVVRQLTKYPLVSTTDHHGPIDNPFFVNANIISGIPYAERGDPDLSTLIVFSFSGVSVNNGDAYPRGILFHGGVGPTGNLIRLPILPDKLKMGVVYAMRGYTRDDLTKAELELSKKEKAGEIAQGRGEKVRVLMEEYFAREDVLDTPDLNTQVSIINYHLWPRFFHPPVNSADADRGAPAPDLIYLEIETLVTRLLLKRHLQDPSSLLYRALFEEQFIRLGSQYFNNIPGAFSKEKGWGTYFFWAMDEKLHRVRLMLSENGQELRSQDNSIVIPWTPAAITEALVQKRIHPSMLLSYLTVSLYYGMKCLGGFCQVNDLTVTKEAWARILQEVGEAEEAQAVVPVQTKELGGDGMVLPYFPTSEGSFVPATGIDMILYEGDTRFEKYIARSRHVTLSEMMNPMLVAMYQVLYTAAERDPELMCVTPEQILRATGLQQKLTEGFGR